MRQWLYLVALGALLLILGLQWQQLQRLRSVEQDNTQRAESIFTYAIRRADFQALPSALDRLAAAEGITETVERFKAAQTLAVAFTDDLLMLNDLRQAGPPIGHGLQYGDYRYSPATPEQEALMWKIARGRPYAILWAMERKLYIDEGVMQESDRIALSDLTVQVRAISATMDEVRAVVDSGYANMTSIAAGKMEELAAPLDALDQLGSRYEAGLPSLVPTPGSLYDRLYGPGTTP